MNALRTPSILVFLFLVGGNLSAQTTAGSQPSLETMDAAKWRSDLKFMADRIEEVHKDPFNKVSREEFTNAVSELNERIPSLENHEVVVGLMKIVAMVGDGHTGLRWGPIAASGVLPVRFYQFEDGIFIQHAAPEHSDLVGSRVVSVNGVKIVEAVKRIKPLIWRDNPMGVKSMAPVFLSVPPLLHAVGLAESPAATNFTLAKDGSERTVELNPGVPIAQLWSPPADWTSARKQGGRVPLWLRSTTENFWYEVVPETKTFYIQFNAVQNKTDETVEAFFQRAFEAAEKADVDRLVIDMRRNGGGNNYLNRPLTIAAIKSRLNVRGRFFVIIGRETFSAAQNAVNDLEKYTNAIFVGEPTGASPNHFGDARQIQLPNSGIRLQASTLWWQDKDPRDTRIWKAPDVAADMTFDDFRNGRDPAMEAILSYKPVETIDQIVAEARESGDLERLIAKYKSFRANPAHKYIDTMSIMNRVGHFLLNNDRVDESLRIFVLNAQYNPDSAIVYQSLGDVYAIKGDKARAVLNYRKAVSIDPSLTASIGAIKALSEK